MWWCRPSIGGGRGWGWLLRREDQELQAILSNIVSPRQKRKARFLPGHSAERLQIKELLTKMTVSEKKALKIRLQLRAGGVTGQTIFILGTPVQDALGSLASVMLPSCANLPLQQTDYLSCQTACLPTPPLPQSPPAAK